MSSFFGDNVYEDVNGAPGRALQGVEVYIYTQAGQLAALTNSGGAPIANPVTTDASGAYSFYAADGLYRADFRYNGRFLSRDNQVPVGVGVPLPNDVLTALGGDSGSALVGYKLPATGAVARPISSKLAEIRTFQDFGAKGDFNVDTQIGTDDTAAIQAAIDWAYGGGTATPRAIHMTDGYFLCGNITMYPYTTIIGTGRHTSAFWCKTGTTGVWFSAPDAQKLMLSGIVWFGRGQTGVSHGLKLGETTPYGTEGRLSGLWVRDLPNGHGMWVNANVGIFEAITAQSCANCIRISGNSNFASNIVSVAATGINVDLIGTVAAMVEIEATASGGLPLRMAGDCHVHGLVISTATGFTHSHLVEVDVTNFFSWTIGHIAPLGTGYTITNGMVKVIGGGGSAYYGGTSPVPFDGSSFLRSPTFHHYTTTGTDRISSWVTGTNGGTEKAWVGGDGRINSNAGFYRSGTQVVGARDTGWTAMTGTGSKGALAAAAAGTASGAYVQAELQGALNRLAAVEARLKSYDAALITHGLIGA